MQNDLVKKFYLYIGVIFLLVLLSMVIISAAEKSRSGLPVYGTVPDFTFTNFDGQPYGRADMLGSICIVDFIFTNCKSACPIMVNEMSKFYNLSNSDKVKFVSISVDPDRDTPEVLARYAEEHGATDGRWKFLRAPVEDVVKLSEKGFFLPAENLPMGHSPKLVLVDEAGNIRGYYNALVKSEMDVLKNHLIALARLMK